MGVSMSVMDKFGEWCRSKGERVKHEEHVTFALCIFPRHLKDEEIREFIGFVDANRHDLRKKGYEVCITHEARPIGGYKEWESICYTPLFDEISVSVKHYSDIGVSGELKERPPEFFFRQGEDVDSYRIIFKKSMDVEFNKTTNEWRGLGLVGADLIYEVVQESPDIVVKVLDKARDDASYYANKALRYVKPREKE